jgi:hypothetical protein
MKYNPFQVQLLRRGAFRDYIPKFFSGREAKLSADWSPDEAMLTDFHASLLKANIQFTEAEFAENRDWIKVQLKREALVTAAGLDESTRYAIESDPAVLKAIDSLPKAQALLDSARKQMVQLEKRSRNR